MKRTAIVVVAALLLALTGCGSPSPDQAFVDTIRESVQAPVVADATDADIIDLGTNVCETFENVGFNEGLPLFIQKAKGYGLTAKDAGAISGAAVGAYCPEFSANFE